LSSKTPNVVIVMTDQQQARPARREGFALDTTPFLDSLAGRGVWFDKAYTTSPLCAPARVSLLTGRYPGAHGVRANPTLRSGPRYERDIVDVLAAAGYATAMVGKNHSHLTPERMDHWYNLGHAAGYGNDEIDRTAPEKAFDKWIRDLRHGVADRPSPGGVECQGPYRAVSDAIEWVRQVKERPFFLWLTFAEPHNPFQVPEPYFSMFPIDELPPVWAGKEALDARGFKWQFIGQLGRRGLPRYDELLPRMRANYYGMLRLIDEEVKRFTEALAAEGVLGETLIFFVSDHGDFVGDYGLMRKGPEMPEDLMRIPFLAAGPGVVAGDGPQAAHVSLADVMPTICEAVGVPIPPGVQGRSLWPILTGADYPAEEFAAVYAEQGFGGLDYTWDDEVDFEKCSSKAIHFDCLNQYSQCGVMRMLRKDRYKLIYDMQGRGWLYDLEADPGELVDLFDDAAFAEVRHAMVEELLTRSLRAQDPLPLPGGSYERKGHPRNYWTDG